MLFKLYVRIISIDNVQDDLTKDRHVSEKGKTIVIDESKWLDDVMDPSERDASYHIERDAFPL